MRKFLRGMPMKMMFAILCAGAVFGDTAERLRMLPVKATPESETSTVIIQLPQNKAVVKADPVWLQVRVEGYPLGAASQFDRASEIAISDQGQSIHVVVDNMPYFAVVNPALDPFNEAGWYYETNYKFEVPAKLEAGEHFLRVFLARSYGESLKGEYTFQASTFFVGADGVSSFDFKTPFLTYNEPSNNLYLVENSPILLDFIVTNCALSADGYKVRLTIDEKATRNLVAWQPYYLYGLKAGKHTIRLELLDSRNNVIKGPFNNVQHTITVHEKM
jgi:hypothetical protein